MIARYRPLLVKLFSEVQRVRADPFHFAPVLLNLQEILIRKITHVERQVRRLRASSKELKKLLGTKTSSLSKDDSQKAKDRIARYQAQIDEYQELLTILRWIGDALAFSLVDRWDIKAMALHKESAGFLSGKKGARRERGILRALFHSGFVAILNDLTNCLRYGDIAVFDKDGRCQIVEVKSSRNRSQRVERQLNELGRVLEYLRTDRTDRLYGSEINIQRVTVPGKLSHHTGQLNEVIAEALAKGIGYREVEDGLYYLAATQFDPEVLKQIGQRCRGKMITALVDPQAYSELAYYPLPLSIHDPEALYMLCVGKLAVVVAIDAGVLEQKLEANRISLDAIGENEDYVLSVRHIPLADDQPDELKIGNHLFDRIFTEFMSLDWIVQLIVTLLNTDTVFKSTQANNGS